MILTLAFLETLYHITKIYLRTPSSWIQVNTTTLRNSTILKFEPKLTCKFQLTQVVLKHTTHKLLPVVDHQSPKSNPFWRNFKLFSQPPNAKPTKIFPYIENLTYTNLQLWLFELRIRIVLNHIKTFTRENFLSSLPRKCRWLNCTHKSLLKFKKQKGKR